MCRAEQLAHFRRHLAGGSFTEVIASIIAVDITTITNPLLIAKIIAILIASFVRKVAQNKLFKNLPNAVLKSKDYQKCNRLNNY